ncbi:cysteine--tRNA ligase [uncultured Roseovarius sp.]|uniref:cysteine--tRNA ligase n=1 Tax=uncultured Roseovarius sp. TaxID=293344 RepID=UPI0025F2B937|nr:cysteine--tRNA ligase [uncultured Roseovarius sp.]
MTTIKLHNTKTRQKEVFEPLDPDNVRMYVCGPTVYDRAHLGNARPVIVFDVLFRLLRHVYGPEHVTYVRNFTDVDDKINARAIENVGEGGDVNAEIARITEMTTQWFLDDMGALGALEPTQMPRATQYIGQMVAMIEKLIADGHAYEAEGHVLFSVESYATYGALSGRSVDDMIAGSRVEVAPYKRNPMDFVLWKPSSDDLPGWDSPWGRGRPGWHIECSAMSYELLGESFDIHGGGNDLMFPHHENEIAQSCCAHPEGGFAQVWMHNEMLQVEGKKMSKSLGNFFTVHDLLEQGYPGEVIRFVFLSTHYRKPMDWTEAKAREAEKTLRKWYAQAAQGVGTGEPYKPVINLLADDLNSAGAIAECHQLSLADDVSMLRHTLQFLGLMGDDVPAWASAPKADLSEFEVQLFEARKTAMKTKDFSEVDRLKSAFVEAGVEVRMSKERVELVPGPGFDPAKLEGVV